MLTSQPGTLVSLNDGQINQGAEIENRKAFVLLGKLPSTCFDLLALPTGLQTFGSTESGSVTIPAGLTGLVTYERLRHPWVALINDGFLDPAMTGVTTSCSFNGQAFVSASFAAYNGSVSTSDWDTVAATFLFYNGSPIVDHYLGVVQGTAGHRSGSATDQWTMLANELAAQVTSYFGTDYTGAFVQPSFVTITGPVNQAFAITTYYTTSTTNNFTLATQFGSLSNAPITAVGATTTFYLTGGASGQITSLVDAASVALIGSPVPLDSTLYQTAVDLVAAIQAKGTGYTATASLYSSTIATVIITAPTTSGAAPNGQVLTLVTATIKASATPEGGAAGTSTYAFTGGVTGAAGVPQLSNVLFYGTNFAVQWNPGDQWGFDLVANNVDYTVGAGNIAGLVPTYSLALGTKVNIISGTTWGFSEVDDATRWEQQDTGAGTITLSDQSFSPSSAVALASYQGRMAVFSRSNIQIWVIDADPSLYDQVQLLENIGTFAPLSVQSIGDLDVFFLSDSGIRSLRVRDSSLNAFVTDLGSPIDQLIIANLAGGTAQSNAAACGIVEPENNRYWLLLNGVMYVLSYFPSLKISAWSTYSTLYRTDFGSSTAGAYTGLTIGRTYVWTKNQDISLTCGATVLTANGTFVATATSATVTSPIGMHTAGDLQEVTPFTPVKMLLYKGQVYILDTNNNVIVYGGTGNNTYDGTPVSVILPWLDDKEPIIEKQWETFSYAASGKWNFLAATDPIGGTFQSLIDEGNPASPNVLTDSSFPYTGQIPFSGLSTHIQLMAVSDYFNQGRVVLGCLALTYKEERVR